MYKKNIKNGLLKTYLQKSGKIQFIGEDYYKKIIKFDLNLSCDDGKLWIKSDDSSFGPFCRQSKERQRFRKSVDVTSDHYDVTEMLEKYLTGKNTQLIYEKNKNSDKNVAIGKNYRFEI